MGSSREETHSAVSLVRAGFRKIYAGLGGAAAGFLVFLVTYVVGVWLEGPLDTRIARWEMAPFAVMILSVVGGFVAGILGSFGRHLTDAALTGAVSVGSFLTWMALRSGSPTGVIVWGISVGFLVGTASGAVGALSKRDFKK